MIYYFIDTEYFGNTQRHIMQLFDDGSVVSFPLTDDNPNTGAYLAWVAEGNTPQEWRA